MYILYYCKMRDFTEQRTKQQQNSKGNQKHQMDEKNNNKGTARQQ